MAIKDSTITAVNTYSFVKYTPQCPPPPPPQMQLKENRHCRYLISTKKVKASKPKDDKLFKTF